MNAATVLGYRGAVGNKQRVLLLYSGLFFYSPSYPSYYFARLVAPLLVSRPVTRILRPLIAIRSSLLG